MKRAFLGLVLLFLSLPAQAREVVSYELPNGLKVALAPDETVPKVAMYLRYRVGSMNEPAGRSGFAHLFEHLMFSGTTNWPNVFGAHLAHGNSINAWTSEDGTVYHAQGVSANLPMMLSLEADRMANIGGEVEQRELELQRDVVKNEMRQNVLDQAGGSGWQAMWSGMFPHGHPYSRSVIGSMADLDAATLADVHGFFNTYYVPNNAVLAVVGDFDIDEARALIEATFGVVPAGSAVPTPSAPEAEPTRIRLELEDRLPSPWVMIGHTGPREGAPENGALRLVAEIMGNGEYGFLRQRLVAGKRLASSVDVSWDPGLLGGRFTVSASALPGITAETLEASMKEAIAEFLTTPIDPADVERARSTLLLGARRALEPYDERASRIAYALDILGDAGAALTDDPQVTNATVAEVAAAAAMMLDPGTASVLVVRPGARGGYPSVLTDSTGDPEPFSAPERAAAPVPVLTAGTAREAEPPTRTEAKLSNGVALVHYQLPASPMAYVGVVADGGWTSASPGREGLLEMAADMSYRGAGGRAFAEFAKAAKDVGADISYRAEMTSTAVTLSVPGENFGDGAALLADAVLRPLFDAEEWEQAVAARLDSIAWDGADLATVAWWAVEDMLLPATATEPGARWTKQAVEAMTLDEAKAAYLRLFQPSSSKIVSVGPLALEEVVDGLEMAFAGWTDSEPGFSRMSRGPATFSEGLRIVIAPEPGASQAVIEIARPAPGFAQSERAAAIAVARLLGGDFTSRLNSVIREEKGYSYGVSAGLLGTIGNGSALYAGGPVDLQHAGAALSEFFSGFGSLATTPPVQSELDRTVAAYRMTLAGIAETGGGLFAAILANDGNGVSLEEYYERTGRVLDLDLEEVRKAALYLSSLKRGYVAIAGDPEAIMPQIEALGLKAELLQRQAEDARDARTLLQPPPPAEPMPGGARRTPPQR